MKKHTRAAKQQKTASRGPSQAGKPQGLKLFNLSIVPSAPESWPSLSLCMIVRNEAANLRACIESLTDLASELIVVDTGSTDATVEIAGQMNASVYHFDWIDDFAAARNESLSHATKEWVIWMDADDRLPSTSVAQIKRAIASGQADAFSFQVESPSLDGSHVTTEHVRLFRNLPQIRFSGAIHESVGPALSRTSLRLARSDILVRHEGYASREAHAGKTRRNLAIIERQMVANPENLSLVFFRGQARGMLDDGRGMAEDMRKYLAGTRPRPGLEMERFWAYTSLSSVLIHDGRWEELRGLLDLALSEFPLHPALMLARSEYLLAKDCFVEAEKLIVAAARACGGKVPYLRPSQVEIDSVLARVRKAEKPAPSITVCMIVKNEAENLAPCLESLGSLASEIIVVDTGSTDNTAQVAERLGAKLYRFDWIDNFASARNESLSHAKGDWMFWLDADDRLDAATVARLRDAAASERADAFSCLVVSANANGMADQVEHVRLFRNHRGISFSGAVHESVYPDIARLGLRLARTNITVRHVGYEDYQLSQGKNLRNLRILDSQLVHSPDQPDLLFYRGNTRANLDDHEGAEADMSRVLELTSATPNWGYYRSWAYIKLAHSLSARDRLDAALEGVVKALAEFPEHSGVLAVAGTLQLQAGLAGEALRSFESALSHIEMDAPGYRPSREQVEAGVAECRGLLGAGGEQARGLSLMRAGRHLEAAEFFAAAIEEEPEKPVNYRFLATALDQLGEKDQALEAWKLAETLEAQQGRAWKV